MDCKTGDVLYIDEAKQGSSLAYRKFCKILEGETDFPIEGETYNVTTHVYPPVPSYDQFHPMTTKKHDQTNKLVRLNLKNISKELYKYKTKQTLNIVIL